MKTKLSILIVLIATICGCALVGKNAKPPTQFEHGIYDVTTNHYEAPIVVSHPDGTLSTNLEPRESYTYTLSAKTRESTNAVATVVNAWLPGIGTLVGTALTGALLAWGKMRGVNNSAPVLAQQIETLLEFISTLPDGDKIRSQVTAYLEKHQLETGTADAIWKLIDTYVSNPTAKGVAGELSAALAALK